MSILAGKEYPARDCGKPRPVVKRRGADGVVRVHRLPWVPYIPMVDMEGSVVDVPLHNGGANAASGDPYRSFVLERKIAMGFVPANRCPLSESFAVRRHLPDERRSQRPCDVTTTGLQFKELNDGTRIFPAGHFCQCVASIIAERTAAHAEIERKRKSAQETIAEIQARHAKDQVDAQAATATKLTEVLGRVVDVLEAQRPAPEPTPAPKSREPRDPR